MPKGENRPVTSGVLSSAIPSPSASRSKVMRLALGFLPEPAFFITIFWIVDLIDAGFLGPAGFSVSATSTSPLGRT